MQPFLSIKELDDIFNAEDYLARAIKESVESIRKSTDAYFLEKRQGVATAQRLAASIDVLLQFVITKTNLQPEHMCLLATGGYGRGTLAPYSDIDLLLLYDDKNTPDTSQFVALLWDTGLKIGFISRPCNDIPSEHTAETAFLDARLLWGDKTVFQEATKYFHENRDKDAFKKEKIAERLKRLQKYDATSGLVEPDVKDGIGALRDIDYIRWMEAPVPIKDQLIITEAEKLLWTIRVGIHLLHHGGSNRLSFSIQQELARLLQYRSDVDQQEAARMMKLYHLRTRQIQRIADRLLKPVTGTYPSNNQQFFNVLCYAETGAETLHNMHQDDVLEKFIPDMKRLKGAMQFDMYHKFTVDVHTLKAIEMMHRIKTGMLEPNYDFATECCQQTNQWQVLCLAIFCHDLAKGMGGDHSLKGMDLVSKYGEKFDVSAQKIKLAQWLIEHHLLFTFNAFRRDINDPDVVESFVEEVQTKERLECLFILTIADVTATNPQLLNNWKKALLEQLYNAALNRLSEDEPIPLPTLRKKHPVLKQLPYEWFLAFSKTQQQEQLNWLKEPVPNVHIRVNSQADVGVITIITHDRHGLFADITASMLAAQLNIVEARLFTIDYQGETLALDIFTVQDKAGKAPQTDHLERFADQVTAVIKENKTVPSPPSRKPNMVSAILPTQIRFDLKGSRRYLIIEVTTLDRVGLLADCAATLRNLNLPVFRARINTQAASAMGRQIIDTFYVTDENGEKITQKRRLKAIENALKCV